MIFAPSLITRCQLTHYLSAGVGPLTVTNAQKLSLSPSSPTDGTTIVAVSDGFVVSGAGSDVNAFVFANGTAMGGATYGSLNGFVTVSRNPPPPDTELTFVWNISNQADGSMYFSDGDEENPWDVVHWNLDGGSDPLPALTHPAIQVLVAPDSSQGGVAVIGGTQDGIYPIADNSNGKPAFGLLGDGGGLGANANVEFNWSLDLSSQYGIGPSSAGWAGVNSLTDGLIYYSLSDTLTPDLASDWLNAADDTPASITVTSVSVSEIYAGLFVTNDGVTNGSSYVLQPFHGRQYYMGLNGGGSNNMHWDTDYNVWTDDVGVWTTDNVAFPFQGTDNGGGGHTGATFAMNHVANERNWEVV